MVDILHKPVIVTIVVSTVVTFGVVFFCFSPEKGESEYYKQYLQISDGGRGLYKTGSGKVDEYIQRMRDSIQANQGSVGDIINSESGSSSSGTPNSRTGDFTQTSDGFTAGDFTVHVDPNSDRGKVVAAALSMLGCPYAWGGTGGPWSGILKTHNGQTVQWSDPLHDYDSRIGMPSYDCSGFCQAAYSKGIGKDIPRSSGEQVSGGNSVSLDALQPGDLVGDGGHVVMWLGDGNLIESPTTGKSVRIISLENRYGGSWPSNFKAANYF